MPIRIFLAIALGAAIAVPAAVGALGDVARLSLTSAGAQLAEAADGPVISADGTRVLFTSAGVFSDVTTGNIRQLFSRDLGTGRVTLASSSATGGAAASDVDDDPGRLSTPYGSSFDGRYVTFSSTAASLLPGDTNARQRDVFRKDLLSGAIVIVSRDASGNQPSRGVTGEPSISADGARVAFTSGTEALTPDDHNGVPDVYVADLRANTLTLVSRTASGTQSPEATGHPSISADGRAVAFEGTAAASVITPEDTDGQADVYVVRLATRAITVASVPATSQSDDQGASLPALSGDGTRIAFVTAAAMAVGDDNARDDIYVRHLPTSTTTRVSATATTGRPAIAYDGQRVAFADAATPVATWVRTLATESLTRTAQSAAGVALGADATRATLSGNGAVSAFAYSDGNEGNGLPSPVSGDTNAVRDVFATQISGGDTTPPSLVVTSAPSGAKVVVSGRATDASGVMDVAIAGRRAKVADNGTFAMTLTQAIGAASVGVTARDDVGLTSTAIVATNRNWAARGRSSSGVRPQGIRVTITGRTARVRFRIGISGVARVEVRQRVSGAKHLSSFRVIAARQARVAAGTRTLRVALPTRLRKGTTYQVRVLLSSARGMGTAATSVTIRK